MKSKKEKESEDIDSKSELSDDERKRMIEALLKKAIGYQAKDTIEEFGVDDEGKVSLSKKKVQIKHIPPDTTAAKLLIELLFSTSFKNIESMSDEELEEEKNRLLKEIDEFSIN